MRISGMASIFKNASITRKLTFIVCLGAAGLITCAFVGINTLQRVKVNGPVYKEIVRGKDVVADVLPPPEYIIEAYLVTLQLLDTSDPVVQAGLVETSHRLRREFDERHAVWLAEQPEGELRQALVVD